MSENKPEKKKGLSWTIIAIMVVSITPIVGAYISFYTGFGVSKDTVNSGVLIESSSVKKLQDLLGDASGEKPSFERNYLWRIIIPMSEDCNEACQQNLYTTRQVHVRLASKADRVERYVANIGGEAGEQHLQTLAGDHPKLKHFSVTKEQWKTWTEGTNLPASAEAEPYYIIVDQVGFAMMYYTAAHEGKDLLVDIKRILRYTIEK